MTEFAVITGLSGAGRSSAADVLEDLGWFVIDNLPTPLVGKVVELAEAPGTTIEKVALVLGVPPGGGPEDWLGPLQAFSDQVRILFLDARTDVLVRRYESTRRRHPQGDAGLEESIEQERALLAPIKAQADVVVDTSDLNVHQFRDRITELFAPGDGGAGTMQLSVVTFGFKHGLPVDVDMVIDCRFLPNPHWVDELRPLTGRDEPVRDFVLGQDVTGDFLARLDGLLELLLPAYEDEGKAYLSIAFGCTGGRHRSVAIAEEIARRLEAGGRSARVTHRDVDKP